MICVLYMMYTWGVFHVWDVFVGDMCPGWSCRCQRTVDGDWRFWRHDVPQNGRSLRPRAELLEDLRRNELSSSWRRCGRSQNASSRRTPLVGVSDGVEHGLVRCWHGPAANGRGIRDFTFSAVSRPSLYRQCTASRVFFLLFCGFDVAVDV